jgi:hypothetical protein
VIELMMPVRNARPAAGDPMDQSAGGAAARQREIYVHGAAGRRSPVPVDVEELELAARDVMTPEAFA